MYFLRQRLNPKSRRLFQIANVSLILGLLPWIFREHIHANQPWLDAFCGFFLGLSVAINLCCVRSARSCREERT